MFCVTESWNIKFCRQQRKALAIGLSIGKSMFAVFAVFIAFVIIYKKCIKADPRGPDSEPLLRSNESTTPVVINDSTLANAAKEDIKSFLLDRINPDFDLLDVLLGNEALDRKEYREIKSRPTSDDKNARLLEIVTGKGKLREFFEALRDSNQEHLVNYVTANGERSPHCSGDWPLTSREISILNTNQRCLVDSMDVSNDELVTKLHQVGFLTRRQQEHVCEFVHRQQKVRMLLDMLYCSSIKNYYRMIISLRDTNQSHIAKILEGGVILVDVHITLEGDSEAVDRDEDELVTRMQSLLADTLHDLSHCIAEVFKLFMACKRNSIVLYIFCDTLDNLLLLFKHFDSGELKKMIELDFSELVSRNDLVIAKTSLPKDNLEKYKNYFEEVPRIDLSEELLALRKELEHDPMEVTTGESVEESDGKELPHESEDPSTSVSVEDETKEATTGESVEESKGTELPQKPEDHSTSALVEDEPMEVTTGVSAEESKGDELQIKLEDPSTSVDGGDETRVDLPEVPLLRREFFIVSEMHGKVLDIDNGDTSAGPLVIVWPKISPPAKNQLWYFDSSGFIHSALNDLVPESCGGARVKMAHLRGDGSQQWSVVGSMIISKAGEYLDIKGSDRRDGAEVISYAYRNSVNQHWRLENV